MVVARRPADVAAALAEAPDVLAVSTASREGSDEGARAAVAAAVTAVGRLPDILFKKVDSRLKGHVAGEVARFAAAAGRGHALVAPAIPAQGRFVVGGRVTGAGVAVPIDVAAVLAASGLAVAVADARTDADLDAALARAQDGPPAILVGASGLAAALARRLAGGGWSVPRPPLAAPLLLAIGSRDPITVAQVEEIRARTIVPETLAPDGACPPGTGAPVELLRLVPGGDGGFDPAAAGARFAEAIARRVERGACGRCSPAAARPRTRSSGRWGGGF